MISSTIEQPPGNPPKHKRLTMALASASVFVLTMSAGATPPEFRTEMLPIPGGAELITVFGRVSDSSVNEPAKVPLVSILRDTLGDQSPETDRLRYVWVLSSAGPGLLQRAVGSVPFFYWRAGSACNPDRRPAPVIDLSAPARPVWRSLAGWITQVLALDPEGALLRSSSRSYRNNLEDQRRVRLLQGLAVISELEDNPQVRAMLSDPELQEIETRLTLGSQMIGGLLNREKLPAAYIKERTRTEEMRGHNWELLRQRAEANGLYFESFGLRGSSTYALLWIAREGIDSARRFDGQFLAVADPYRDPRLMNWKGYRQVRDGKEMIPLSLYALDYPKVPLLLVDFRATHSPKRREMIRHAATDVASGVLGISRVTNLPYLFGSTVFNFVRVRHGAANDRTARLKAYAEVRQWLALDGSVDPGLRAVVQKNLEVMGVNPMEESLNREADVARRQYAALVRYAMDPKGLPARIERDRSSELAAYRHGAGPSIGFRLAHVASLGTYAHHEKETGAELEAQLGRDRRIERGTRFLETVARSGPQAEIVWNMDDVRRAVDEIGASGIPRRSSRLLAEIISQTRDQETREIFERALQGLDTATGGGME